MDEIPRKEKKRKEAREGMRREKESWRIPLLRGQRKDE